MKEKRYYRAVGVAEFIVEGHTIAETEEEFGITKCTIQRDLQYLSHFGYGEELAKNQKLFIRAKVQLKRNIGACKRKAVSC